MRHRNENEIVTDDNTRSVLEGSTGGKAIQAESSLQGDIYLDYSFGARWISAVNRIQGKEYNYEVI